MKNLASIFKRFPKSTDGNVAVMMALTITMIGAVVGVGVDYTRLMQASTKLTNITDNAALAAAEVEGVGLEKRKELFEGMMELGLANSPELSGYEYTLTYEDIGLSKVLKATTRSEANLFFPVTQGDGKFVSTLSEVKTGTEEIEIALVLDISNSMTDAKIAELKNSARNFILAFMGNTSIQKRVSVSIVPFGGSVRLTRGTGFMLGTPPPGEDWAAQWTDGEWNGCVSTATTDFKTGITPQDRLDYIPDFTSYRLRNSWCPEAGNEMVGLTRNRNALLNKVDGLTLSSGTALDVGVTWGLATLDPRWRGHVPTVRRAAPGNFDEKTQKIMVVMADGGITAQNFPEDYQLASESPPYHTNNRLNTEAQANTQYEEICDLVKSKGIEVYTVGFDLNNQGDLDRLRYCGSSERHNFKVDTGELNTAFEGIAKNVSPLRLSR